MKSLRIVDASIIPTSLSGNSYTTQVLKLVNNVSTIRDDRVCLSVCPFVCLFVCLSGYTHQKTITRPSTNRARRGLTSFMRRTPLTTTPRRQLYSPSCSNRIERALKKRNTQAIKRIRRTKTHNTNGHAMGRAINRF